MATILQQWLHMGEVENLIAAQATGLNTSAVPVCQGRPGGFLESHWSSIQGGAGARGWKRLHSDIIDRYMYQQDASIYSDVRDR